VNPALTQPGPAISFADVTKQYGPVLALDQVSFTIAPGEMVALLGPNGAGKSTTVDILLGLRHPDQGTARVLGQAPQQATGSGRVGAMLQSGSLPGRATASEVVDLARRLYHSPHTLDHLLELAGLTEFAHRRTDRLSGGQARRVQLAVALAGDPEILFLDEPTTGLDVQSRRLFWDGVRQAAQAGTTVLFATHYLDEADTNATRILVLAGGRLVADGPPAAIKARLPGCIIRAAIEPAPLSDLRRLPGVLSVTTTAAGATTRGTTGATTRGTTRATTGGTTGGTGGTAVELRTSDPDRTLHALYRSGAQIRDLQISRASLEDALIHLTTPAPAAPTARSTP
jgi:ABC-2 type transport system ATP-binding protein